MNGTAIATALALVELGGHVRTKWLAFNMCKDLAGPKGIVNLGSGCGRSGIGRDICRDPMVVANVDIRGVGPHLWQMDLEKRLVFRSKQFGCAFASHVLEHLEDWEGALNEFARIADYVVVVLPKPWAISNRTHPDHKRIFTQADVASIEARWPTVRVFM